MFKKKPFIKTLSPLRSSDRRKTADRIISEYALQPASGDTQEEKDAAAAAHTNLRKSLLPDNALSARFTTTSGPNLKEVSGTVLVGSHGSGEQRVLWVEVEKTIYPTVYTLWQNPGICALLHTPSMVVNKLRGGADLMTPGLAGPPFPPHAKKGAVVAVASLESPSVPVVIGRCAIDVSSLTTTQGAKGHAVETFHWAGDDLWNWSTSGRPGATAPEECAGWVPDDSEELAAATQKASLEDGRDVEEEGGVSLLGEEDKFKSDFDRNGYVSGEDPTAEQTQDKGGTMATHEIDHAFREAFLYGVHKQIKENRSDPKHGLTFPLFQSLVMSSLVLPFLPVFTPEQAQYLNIKKTSWKNAKKLIRALHNDKLLLSKEQKNEAMVLDIDFEDDTFQNFKPYPLPEKENSGSSGTDAAQNASANGASRDDSLGQQLKIVSWYKPKDSLGPMFKSLNPRPSYCTAADVRKAVTDYFITENLTEPSNRRLVRVDPIISNAIFDPSSGSDADILAKGSMPREALIDRVTSLCAPFHSILRNGEEPDLSSQKSTSKPKAGPTPKIGILLETRGGNKTVTRVYGFEPFYVNPQALADELRKLCASSTSIEPFKGGKGMEVMVQGPQEAAIKKALERRGVASRWVEVTNKTKGKKKS